MDRLARSCCLTLCTSPQSGAKSSLDCRAASSICADRTDYSCRHRLVLVGSEGSVRDCVRTLEAALSPRIDPTDPTLDVVTPNDRSGGLRWTCVEDCGRHTRVLIGSRQWTNSFDRNRSDSTESQARSKTVGPIPPTLSSKSLPDSEQWEYRIPRSKYLG